MHARDGGELLLQTSLEHRQIHTADLKDRCEQSLRLFGKCEQYMCRRDFLMIAHCRNLLCRLERSQRPRSIFILFHRYPSTVFLFDGSIITDKVKKSNRNFDFLTFNAKKLCRHAAESIFRCLGKH